MAKKLNKSSLLWFIRSRPYTTVAELRRRFTLEPEDVQPIKLPHATYFVGLPERPAGLLAQLIQEGRVGIELALDVHAPVVEGLYPMDLREFRERVTADRSARAGAPAVAPAGEAEDEDDADSEE